jgi:hypothetical protein
MNSLGHHCRSCRIGRVIRTSKEGWRGDVYMNGERMSILGAVCTVQLGTARFRMPKSKAERAKAMRAMLDVGIVLTEAENLVEGLWTGWVARAIELQSKVAQAITLAVGGVRMKDVAQTQLQGGVCWKRSRLACCLTMQKRKPWDGYQVTHIFRVR